MEKTHVNLDLTYGNIFEILEKACQYWFQYFIQNLYERAYC